MNVKLPKPTPDQQAYLETMRGNYSPKDRTMSETGQTEPTLLETVDLFLNGDGSGIGGRDLIRKLAAELTRLQQSNAALVEACQEVVGWWDEESTPDKQPDFVAACRNALSQLAERT